VASLAWLGEEDKVRLQEERIKVEKGDRMPFLSGGSRGGCARGRDAPGPLLPDLGTHRGGRLSDLEDYRDLPCGCEHVDVRAATERGILVFNVQGRNAGAVSDFTIGLILAECRNIARSTCGIMRGVWRKEFQNGGDIPEFTERTVGLIGFGWVGKLVCRKLSGFEVNVLVHDPYVKDDVLSAAGARPAGLRTLLKESDFVCIHARLTPENRGLIGAEELSLMKPTAYLINTARAGLVDEEALVETLRKGAIAGAGLDVFHHEPIAPDHPLLTLDNVTLTSHLAGTTREALSRSPVLLVEDIIKYLAGEKSDFIVNPQVLDRAE